MIKADIFLSFTLYQYYYSPLVTSFVLTSQSIVEPRKSLSSTPFPTQLFSSEQPTPSQNKYQMNNPKIKMTSVCVSSLWFFFSLVVLWFHVAFRRDMDILVEASEEMMYGRISFDIINMMVEISTFPK